MKPETDQDLFERVLRWMSANLEVASSVYHTEQGVVRVLPAVTIAADGSASRSVALEPVDLHDWQLTSATALIACCYIDALGKVVTRNIPRQPDPNYQRFRAFVDAHMGDFILECSQKGGDYSVEVLYRRYRCDFVHQFAERDAHWGRQGRKEPYWYKRSMEPALNVDRFVRGVIDAIQDFRTRFPSDPNYGPDQYAHFRTWLLGA